MRGFSGKCRRYAGSCPKFVQNTNAPGPISRLQMGGAGAAICVACRPKARADGRAWPRRGKKRTKAAARPGLDGTRRRGLGVVARFARCGGGRGGAGGGDRLLHGAATRPRRAARRARARVGHAARPLGRGLRLARAAARRDPGRGGLAAPGQRDHRHRGPAVLLALRRRHPRHRTRGAGQLERRPDGAGRLLDHPAGGQARLLRQHPHARAQDQGGPGGHRAGAPKFSKERDPVGVSQPRLSRRRRHRLRGSIAALLRQVGGGGEPSRGGDAGGPLARALALRPDQRPRPGAGPGGAHRRADGGAGLPDRRAGGRGAGAAGGACRRPPRRGRAAPSPIG